MSRRIVLCADDYALAPGVSSAIRELIARGRINATSVMTIFPEFEAEAKALQAIRSPIPFLAGLHVTLTGGFEPLAASPLKGAAGRLPASSKLLPPLGYLRADRRAVKIEVKAQLEKFARAFGRPPDYVDGHQHVQLMPGVRAPFLEAVAELAPKAWVRQCAPARLRDDLFTSNKGRFLGVVSRGFRRQARRHGLAYNPAFSGAYDYDRPKDFGPLFAGFLKGLPAGGVVMCHPGHVDDILIARDTLTGQREKEYAFLMSDEMPRVLQRAGASLS
jgi:predicted glycoside hydrolase/deacetylase ChbG (UPF0249 family)